MLRARIEIQQQLTVDTLKDIAKLSAQVETLEAANARQETELAELRERVRLAENHLVSEERGLEWFGTP